MLQLDLLGLQLERDRWWAPKRKAQPTLRLCTRQIQRQLVELQPLASRKANIRDARFNTGAALTRWPRGSHTGCWGDKLLLTGCRTPPAGP